MHVAIVGGGLAGLVAARDLQLSGLDVTLLDEGNAPGGQVRTIRDRGFVVDGGAEGFVAGDPATLELSGELGIGHLVMGQRTRRVLLLSGNTLRELDPRQAAHMLGIPTPDGESKGIESFQQGMGTLVEALVASLAGVSRRQSARVTKLERRAARWKITMGQGTELEADAVVLAVPPAQAAALLTAIDLEAAGRLTALMQNSNVSVSLAYPAAGVAHPLDAGGFILPPGSHEAHFRACTFCTSKFPDRAPPGMVLLRAFFRPPGAIEDDDAVWVDRAVGAVSRPLGISTPPVAAWVGRWPASIPQYAADHREIMMGIGTRLRAHGALALAGAAYEPGGVPGAVRSGRAAALSLLGSPLPA